MKTTTTIASLSLIAALALAGTASAQVVDLNGGSSWNGWNSVGNSQTSGLWVKGATNRTYDIYSTSFVLNASQTASGTGNDTASLFSNSWQAGDRIIGMGIQYTGSSRGNQFFFHTDTGAVNILAASSFGAGDGVYTADVGDTSSHMFTNNSAGAGLVRQYSVFNDFTWNGGSNFDIPYGIGSSLTPVRSFTVADAGAGFYSTRVQFLMNVDAILRSNGGATFGEGSFGSTLRVGFWEQDISAGFSQQVFSVPVPAPGAFALLGLAGLAGARRRR
jgi:MYXO-CTERM domain-containing protein